MTVDDLPAYDDLPLRGTARSAWGVFGADDQLGTLNLLTPERVRAAAALVETGERISLVHPLDLPAEQLTPSRTRYRHNITVSPNGMGQDDSVDGFFLQYSSQWDSLRHVRGHADGFYNGVSPEDANAVPGRLGIEHVARRGIVGRGVLLDIAAYLTAQGRPPSPRERWEITPELLDEVAAAQGSEVSPGDILLFRTGFSAVIRDGGVGRNDAGQMLCPGLAQTEDTLRWLWNHHVAAVVGDNFAVEAWPAATPESGLHGRLIGMLGLTLGEIFDLDAISAAAAQLGRHHFLVVANPLYVPGGVGSPANALAIL